MGGRPSLCVALDSSDRDWVVTTAKRLVGHVGWLKVGLEAFSAHGPDLVTEVAALGPQVFLDLKLHDIPATTRRAAANCAACGASMFTVHAAGGRSMLEAAVEGARQGSTSSPPKVVAVTVLTSLDSASLAELQIPAQIRDVVVTWARLAQNSGLDGVVASACEAAAVRRDCGVEFLIVTPGIRPAASATDDQRRVVTPAEAVRSGANMLVVGRPVTGADDPAQAASAIVEEMAAVTR
ncbi:MAG: orotidine-5'-phosphate decarboxylase [Acidobacteriota bacterium]